MQQCSEGRVDLEPGFVIDRGHMEYKTQQILGRGRAGRVLLVRSENIRPRGKECRRDAVSEVRKIGVLHDNQSNDLDVNIEVRILEIFINGSSKEGESH